MPEKSAAHPQTNQPKPHDTTRYTSDEPPAAAEKKKKAGSESGAPSEPPPSPVPHSPK